MATAEGSFDRQAEDNVSVLSAMPAAGIVIFDDAMHLQFADQRARALLAETDESQRSVHRDTLPLEIIKIGTAVRDDGIRPGARRRSRQRTIRTARGSVRLRAFGVPIWKEMLPEFIMVLIERRATRCRPTASTGEGCTGGPY